MTLQAPIYDHLIRVTHGDTVLIDLDGSDPAVNGPIRIEGGQMVEVVPRINAAGKKTFPRGNESHVIIIPIAWVTNTARGSADAVLTWMASLPRTVDAVTVQAKDGTVFEMTSAAVDGWPAKPQWDEESDGTTATGMLRIIGGEWVDAALTFGGETLTFGGETLTFTT